MEEKQVQTRRIKRSLPLVIVSIFMSILGIIMGLSGLFVGVQSLIVYNFSIAQMSTPYWVNSDGTYISVYNEIVMPIKYTKNRSGGNVSTNEAVGFLAYNPYEVTCIRDSTLGTELSFRYSTDPNNNEPIVVDKTTGKITVNTTQLPNNYMLDEWIDGKNLPAGFTDSSYSSNHQYSDGGGTNGGNHILCESPKMRSTHLCVTYEYEQTQSLGFTAPAYEPTKFQNLLAKLNAGTPVNILIFGDSISFGASSTAMMNHPPYQPPWFSTIEQELERRFYDGNTSGVTISNPSQGGTSSTWGVQLVTSNAFNMEGYDLVIIGFGMNDGSLNHEANIFRTNLVTILSTIRAHSPNADYIILGSFTSNPMSSTWLGKVQQYSPIYANIANTYNFASAGSGCSAVNMCEISVGYLGLKQAKMTANTNYDTRYQYLDISANYVNHPNDYMIRLYAGSILSKFINY